MFEAKISTMQCRYFPGESPAENSPQVNSPIYFDLIKTPTISTPPPHPTPSPSPPPAGGGKFLSNSRWISYWSQHITLLINVPAFLNTGVVNLTIKVSNRQHDDAWHRLRNKAGDTSHFVFLTIFILEKTMHMAWHRNLANAYCHGKLENYNIGLKI